MHESKKNKYLTIDTHSRASKWHMGYGSVLLRLGAVRSQSPNRLQKYYIRDMTVIYSHMVGVHLLFFGFMHLSLSYVPKRQGHRSKVKGITDISQ